MKDRHYIISGFCLSFMLIVIPVTIVLARHMGGWATATVCTISWLSFTWLVLDVINLLKEYGEL